MYKPGGSFGLAGSVDDEVLGKACAASCCAISNAFSLFLAGSSFSFAY
jgi:hypothetical protein